MKTGIMFTFICMVNVFASLTLGISLVLTSGCSSAIKSPNAERSIALVNGRIDAISSVIRLTGPGGKCTGAIVGVNPLTVITARHCVEDGIINLETESDVIRNPAIVTADYGNERFHSNNLAGDIAILIFKSRKARNFNISKSELYTVAPIRFTWGDEIKLCGFGSAAADLSEYDTSDGQQRCGSNFILMENQAFEFEDMGEQFEKYAATSDIMSLTPKEQAQLLHRAIQLSLRQYGIGTRLAIRAFNREAITGEPMAALNQDGFFALINRGDSGGPWFLERTGVRHLIGVTSATHKLSGSRRIVTSFAWRIDNAWTRTLLKQAAKRGADITGLTLP